MAKYMVTMREVKIKATMRPSREAQVVEHLPSKYEALSSNPNN
jgi:hypothetical protein